MKRFLAEMLAFSLAAVLGLPSLVFGFQEVPAPTPTIAGAERAYADGCLLEAERQFAALLQTGGPDQGACYDRLLNIYFRMDRHVHAIDLGTRYRQLLVKAGNHDRLRFLNLEMGRCYFALGQRAEAENYLRQATDDKRGAPFVPIAQVAVLELSALCAAARKEHDKAQETWRRIERTIALLPKQALTDDQHIKITWKLAESLGQQKKSDQAIKVLLALLPDHDKLKDARGKRETLRQLGEHHLVQKDFASAEKCFLDALPDQLFKDQDLLAAGDVSALLSDLFQERNRLADADHWRKKAAEYYQEVVASASAQNAGSATLTAFWKLQTLYRKLNQVDLALKLAAPGGLLGGARLNVEHGNLEAMRGAYAKRAQPLLREAVKDLESQTPLNLNLLPRALASLAGVELLLDDRIRAKSLAQRCQDLLDQFKISDDLVRVEINNVLGVCAAQEGKYVEAIDRFRAGVAQCDGLGPTADHLRCHLLLNQALVYKSQGDLGLAWKFCQNALKVYQRFAETDSLGLAAFYAAQTSILVAQHKIPDAARLSERILVLCQMHDVEGPLVVIARHAQALDHLNRLDFDAAQAIWQKVLAFQEKEKHAVLMPRTLNYLALTAELRGDAATAEKLYRRAQELQKKLRAYPATQFITSWRLADLLRKRGAVKEARLLLEEALDLAEKTRLQTFGDAAQRAEFLGQFAPGFDDLVSLHVQEGNAEAAMIASSRSRGRGLLDYLQMAGVDPRSALTGPKGKALIQREAALKTEIAGLRARAALVPATDAGTTRALKLVADFDETQAEYVDVWREILNASPLYRPLVDATAAERVLERLRAKVIGPKTLLLAYHVGRAQSWAFLVSAEKTEVFALTVNQHVAERIGLPEPLVAENVLAGRGLVRVSKSGEAAPPVEADGPQVPLGHFAARALVDHYVQQIANPSFEAWHGFALKSRKSDRPVPAQRLELVGKVFLPAALRQRIKELGPTHLLVIPDGPLHKLPMEALVLHGGAKARYALDELPPIVYAPSAAALALLAERAPVKRQGSLSLLTVGNAAFAATDGKSVLQIKLPLLEGTGRESEGVRKCFDPRHLIALEGKQATEKDVVAAMPGKHFIHLATHGFADDRFGNLFGALAFAPPEGPQSLDNDGLLTLHEIYALPLGACELAVLSACATHVGPQAPLEAGVTLANGFLAAGARRVIASHWPVADNSTALFMKGFFQELSQTARADQPLHFAAALQRARLDLRQQFPPPFYWAPFVLIGAAD